MHAFTKDANSKLREEVSKLEDVNQGLCDLLEKRKTWYDEQLKHKREKAHQVQIRQEQRKGAINGLTRKGNRDLDRNEKTVQRSNYVV